MSKYNRNRRVAKLGKQALLHRRWLENVGDGAYRSTRKENPNDEGPQRTHINRHAAKPGCERGIEVVE